MSWALLVAVTALLAAVGRFNLKRIEKDTDYVYRKVGSKWIKVEGGVL